MIKLSELKAARAAMTQGEMFYDGGDALMVQPHDGATELLGDIGDNMCCEDVDGIVATHNAIDVLIEIAEAALDQRASFSPWRPKEHLAATERLNAALAKVTR